MQDGWKLITVAWAIEIVGVTGGILNSAYTTFGEDLPSGYIAYAAVLPMVAVAVAELGRIPLASVIFHKHLFMKSVAVLGILALGYLAVENWSFGFERIVEMRLKPVNEASRELSAAEAELSVLKSQRDQRNESGGNKRDELRRGLHEIDVLIAGLTEQLTSEAKIYKEALEEIRESCRMIRAKCMERRSDQEDARYHALTRQLNVELSKLRADRKELQSEIDALVTLNASDAETLDSRIVAAESLFNEREQAFERAVDGNQIYRLAASWFGKKTTEVTKEEFATARWFFATLSAIAIASAGSLCALVHYAPNRTPGAPSMLSSLMAKVLRARRAYYARKRKPVVREVQGPERVVYTEEPQIVEKEVPRFIDRIVLIPRFGIRFPTYINALIRRGERTANYHKSDDGVEEASNITQLAKRVS